MEIQGYDLPLRMKKLVMSNKKPIVKPLEPVDEDIPKVYCATIVVNYESISLVISTRNRQLNMNRLMYELNSKLRSKQLDSVDFVYPSGRIETYDEINFEEHIVLQFARYKDHDKRGWFNFKAGRPIESLSDIIDDNSCFVFFKGEQFEYYKATCQIPMAPTYKLIFGVPR